MTTRQRTILLLTALMIVVAISFATYRQYAYERAEDQTTTTATPETTPDTPGSPTVESKIEPISEATSRITKKPFGIYVNPTDSPVAPEVFTGYHSGIDYEATPAEADLAVPVRSICDAEVRFKGMVDGYGGLIILGCTIDSQVVTVLYGHIDISSSPLAVGGKVTTGDFIANLAPGYSVGTSGERKHLHLGIHKGNNIEYRGYVQTSGELEGWMDYEALSS